jgi:predicted RNA-binding Zn ribbon-like protein
VNFFKGHTLNNRLNENAKTILARLLATENISVEFNSSINTAAFDPKNRVLIMPIFEEVSTDVDSLFLGHECGHALFTPQDSIEEINNYRKKGLKDLVNVVEDARIEKMMQKKFGGLRRSFYNAYTELYEKNFFGTGDTDLNTLSFENRLNLHFKVGSRLGIRFSDEEQVFVDRIDNATDWSDVVDISNDLYDYITSKKEEEPEPEPEDVLGNSSEGTNSSDDDDQEQQENSAGDSEEDEEEEKGESQGSEQSSEETDEEGEEESSSAGQGEDEDEETDDDDDSQAQQKSDDESISGGQESDSDDLVDTSTQENFDNSQQSLVNDNEHNERIANVKLPVFNLDNLVVTPSEVVKLINRTVDYYKMQYNNNSVATLSEAAASANQFKTSQKSAVNLMAKEFEMRKSAAEHQRTRVAKTGVLNPNKLHSYRFNEDIFLRQNIVSDGKNHGFIMFLDWSSSMAPNMTDTISQVQLLALFCKKINVPFEVYAFSNSMTDIHKALECSSDRFDNVHEKVDGSFVTGNGFKMFQFFKSGMKNIEFNQAFTALEYIKRSFSYQNSSNDKYFMTPNGMTLRGTPLGEAIMASVPLVERFKKENSLQIVNTVFLTDGAGQLPQSYLKKERNERWNTDYQTHYFSSAKDSVYIHDQGRIYKTSINSRWNLYNEIWKSLYQILKDRTGCSLTGFYISPNRKNHFRRDADHLFAGESLYEMGYTEGADGIFKTMKKDGYVSIKYCSYDSFILIPTNKLNLDEDNELAVDSEMTKAKMANAFIKNRKNNQTNKKMLREFVEIVA